MTKKELIQVIANEAGISKNAAAKAVDAFTRATIDEVAKGGKVQLVGFGTFAPVTRNARISFGKEVPETVVPKFTPGKPFKDAVAK